MRRVCRTDANQRQIVEALRSLGCSVQHLHVIGRGCPDAIVGHAGVNYLIEIKDSSQPPSKRRLTPDEVEWHQNWRGKVDVVCSIEEAIAILTPPTN
ncbi:MAG: hypothetical protein WBB28_10705 [Crinalium sp.]